MASRRVRRYVEFACEAEGATGNREYEITVMKIPLILLAEKTASQIKGYGNIEEVTPLYRFTFRQWNLLSAFAYLGISGDISALLRHFNSRD